MTFSFWKALGYGVSRVRERPVEALRIWAVDAVFLVGLPALIIVMSGAWAGPGTPVAFAAISPLQMVGALVAFACVGVFWFCSEAAWARFMATNEAAGSIPYRLGKDELRIFGLFIFWMVVAAIVTFCMMMPIALFRVLVEEGGGASRAGAALLAALAGAAFVFVIPRINASIMLAVRRKAFSPMGHFNATDPFWFRLGLAFGVGCVLSWLLAYALPGLMAVASGYEADIAMMTTQGSMTPWLSWFALQPPHVLPVIVLLTAWLGAGFGLLVTRGIAAHAALNALEQEEMDARRAVNVAGSSAA